MIFPVGDDQVKGGHKPLFSYAFIGINVIIFLIQLSVTGNLICDFSTIPDEVLKGESLHTTITSMFLHGGWMHLLGNMLFLWIFADNLEAIIGNFNFLIFYLAGGLVATGVHILFNQGGLEMGACCFPCEVTNPCVFENGQATPCPRYIPSLGASGAISAVMGAYLVLFPKSQIKILVAFLFRTFKVSAIVFLGIWFAQQLIFGLGTIGPSAQTSGVAWWAHIGGFVFGLLAGWFIRSQYFGNTKDFYH